jgi:hypothetical protein
MFANLRILSRPDAYHVLYSIFLPDALYGASWHCHADLKLSVVTVSLLMCHRSLLGLSSGRWNWRRLCPLGFSYFFSILSLPDLGRHCYQPAILVVYPICEQFVQQIFYSSDPLSKLLSLFLRYQDKGESGIFE